MLTLSNRNIYRFSGHLCAEFTGQWKASDTELWCSLRWAWTNGWVSNRDAGDLRGHDAHCHGGCSVNRNVRYGPHNMADAEPGKKTTIIIMEIWYKFDGICRLVSIVQTAVTIPGKLKRAVAILFSCTTPDYKWTRGPFFIVPTLNKLILSYLNIFLL